MKFGEFMRSINGVQCVEYMEKITVFMELHVAPEIETYKIGLGMTKIVFMKMDKLKLWCKSEIHFEWSEGSESIQWRVAKVTVFGSKNTYMMEYQAHLATMSGEVEKNERLN